MWLSKNLLAATLPPHRHSTESSVRSFPRIGNFPDRSLSWQGTSPESAVLPLCQLVSGTDLEQQLYPERSGHDGRNSWRSRAGEFFYEGVGAIRDVVQNHMLEVIALLTMEAPIARDPDALRDEKQRAFRAMRPLLLPMSFAVNSVATEMNTVSLRIRRWRHSPQSSCISTHGDGRASHSTFELVSVCLLPQPKYWLNSSVPTGSVRHNHPNQANYFRFRLSPNVSISLGARAKMPGEAMVGEAVELLVRPSSADEMMPYERLLGDAIRGDATLFVREDGVEAAWGVVDPILGNVTPVHEYEPNTWGPIEAGQIIGRDGGWHDPRPIAEKSLVATK